MKTRREAIVWVAELATLIGPALAIAQSPVSKLIDRRNASESEEYGISFAARATSANDYEHAFVVWYYSDSQHHRTNRKGAGFYPAGGDKYDLTIGGTTGIVFDDSKEKIAMELTILVNKNVFEAAQEVQSQYQNGQTYRLLVNDCVTFIEAVAKTIPDLNVPSRAANPTPPRFVSALFESNN